MIAIRCSILALLFYFAVIGIPLCGAYTESERMALKKALQSEDYSTAAALLDKFVKADPKNEKLIALRDAVHKKLESDPRAPEDSAFLSGINDGPVSNGTPMDNVSYWDGDNVSGKASIKINLREQRAYFYKGGKLVAISEVSTGREGSETPKGKFKIVQKDKNHDDGGPMPYFMGLTRSIGLYAGYLPGYPASIDRGILLPEFMAESFFKSVSIGTPVTITD